MRDRVAVVTLDRPQRRNAFTAAMGDSLGRAYRRCDEDDEIRVVVVTGAGDAFCAGFLPAWLDKKPPLEALGHGCRLAASALGMVGARPAL